MKAEVALSVEREEMQNDSSTFFFFSVVGGHPKFNGSTTFSSLKTKVHVSLTSNQNHVQPAHKRL
jgi:hypothetical protein